MLDMLYLDHTKSQMEMSFMKCWTYLDLIKHPQTILAYEMNGETLTIPHGAPLRLRAETQLGYKMVKWIGSIEFVADYKNI
jgi:sulfoxide reductase catalytic subunit YedY